MSILQNHLADYKSLILLFSVLAIFSTSILLLAVLRLAQILPTPTSATSNNVNTVRRPDPSFSNPTHLLIVLGSGGHTAEMLNILTSIPDLGQKFTRRTYLVSSGDSFSATKAIEFEKEHVARSQVDSSSYQVVTVRRARRVHQSFLSTPVNTLQSLWDCMSVLRGTHQDLKRDASHLYPDLIITNGPGTGVCVVIAALILRFFGLDGSPTITVAQKLKGEQVYTGQGQMRTIFIESWARVKTLSLSGKILRPLVNRFLVQWPQLAEILGDGVEYIEQLVS